MPYPYHRTLIDHQEYITPTLYALNDLLKIIQRDGVRYTVEINEDKTISILLERD